MRTHEHRASFKAHFFQSYEHGFHPQNRLGKMRNEDRAYEQARLYAYMRACKCVRDSKRIFSNLMNMGSTHKTVWGKCATKIVRMSKRDYMLICELANACEIQSAFFPNFQTSYCPANIRRAVCASCAAQSITRDDKREPLSFTSLTPSPQR